MGALLYSEGTWCSLKSKDPTNIGVNSASTASLLPVTVSVPWT